MTGITPASSTSMDIHLSGTNVRDEGVIAANGHGGPAERDGSINAGSARSLGSRRARSAEFPEPHDGHAEAQPTNGGRLGHGCGYWSGCDRAGHAIGIGANGPGLINVVYNVGSRGGSSARDHEIPGEYRAVHGKCKVGGEGFSDTRVV